MKMGKKLGRIVFIQRRKQEGVILMMMDQKLELIESYSNFMSGQWIEAHEHQFKYLIVFNFNFVKEYLLAHIKMRKMGNFAQATRKYELYCNWRRSL
ncbi:unnamed protein product [Paramecium pentaurelia]|uniref:Uncharacterized protein n=1 Tax=Paramecium pentaurelia TaxID=43138 RepID=A0A8S1WPQ1_9CILI|nr:unnamed protein product [Paramecium pentaurelia]